MVGRKKYLWTLHGCTTWWWAERNATGLRSSNTPSWLNISTTAISLLIFCLIICEHKTEDRYLWLFVNIKQTTIVFLSWNICTATLWRIAKYCLFLSAILVLPISSQEPEILVDINGNSLWAGTSSDHHHHSHSSPSGFEMRRSCLIKFIWDIETVVWRSSSSYQKVVAQVTFEMQII